MMAASAAYFTEQQGLDIKQGVERRVLAGYPPGRAPYGFRHIRVDGKRTIEPDPVHAVNVRRIFELYAYHGHSIESLIKSLHSEGAIYRDKQPRFNKTKVGWMLNDRTYFGEVFFNGEWHRGAFEPVIDRQTFERAAERLRGGQRRAHQLVYAGKLIQCSHCGGHLTGEEPTKKNKKTQEVKKYRYYRCSQLRTVPGHNKAWRFPEKHFDQQILALFAEMKVAEPEVRDWFVDVLKEKVGIVQQQETARLDEIRRTTIKLEGKKRRLLSMRLNEEIDSETYASEDRQMRDQLAELRLRLEAEHTASADDGTMAVKCFELSQALTERWLTADVRAKRQILEIVGSNYRMEGTTLVVTKRKPFDLLAEGLISQNGGGAGNRKIVDHFETSGDTMQYTAKARAYTD